jgi:hypothetical protein
MKLPATTTAGMNGNFLAYFLCNVDGVADAGDTHIRRVLLNDNTTNTAKHSWECSSNIMCMTVTHHFIQLNL